MSRDLTFRAGRRAKWVVAGVGPLLTVVALGANLPGKFSGRARRGGVVVILRAAAIAALAAGALLASAGGAAAAQLQPARTCYASGETIKLAGSGFTPNVTVSVSGAKASPTTDNDGRFELNARAAKVRGLYPRATTFRAVDADGLMAQIDVPIVSSAFATNRPLAGRPRAPATWRFAGFFATGRPIFGHFRTRGRTVRTYRFGLAQGPCGTLVVRAPHLPVRRPRPGRWRLKLDQRPDFRARAPGRIIRFRVSPD